MTLSGRENRTGLETDLVDAEPTDDSHVAPPFLEFVQNPQQRLVIRNKWDLIERYPAERCGV